MSTPGFADSPPKPRPSPSVAAAPQGFGDKPPGFGAKPPAGFGDAPPATSGFADTPPTDSKPPAGQSGLFSVNAGVDVIKDYLTNWTTYAGGGIRKEFRAVVDNLASTFHLGIYDFDKGHHPAPNDPHLDGRAMDVDTIDGEQVGDKLTPTIRSYMTAALKNPNVQLGVPKTIYDQLPSSMKARVFVDKPAHIHTQLSQVMPGQTVAPAGFKPDTTRGFVKDPQAKPAFGDKPPSNPVILSGRAGGMTPSAQAAAAAAPDQTGQMAHSGLMEVAGHQDLPFILTNALMRDNSSLPSPKTVAEQLKDPKSHVYQAWHLYMKDPAQAMDEYGAGSPIQDQWMAQHGTGINQKTAQESLKHPFLNALQTFGMEQLNPMAWGEGAIAGKIVDLVPEAARALGIYEKSAEMAQTAARGVGLGTPLAEIRARGGVDASQHMKAGISALNAPHMNPYLSKKLPAGGEIEKQVFGGLTPAAQEEVVRLHQGLKPSPEFEAEHGELERRAKILTDDQKAVEHEQKRVDILPPERQFKKAPYFPMSRSYDFGPQHELESELKGAPGAAGGGGLSQHKAFATLDEARASGTLDKDFLPASNYREWRRQRLQRVAFEDWVSHAPASLRRDITVEDFHNKLGIPPQGHYQPSLEGMEHPERPDAPDKFEQINRAFADFNSRLVGEGADPKTTALAKEIGYDPKYGDPRRIAPKSTDDWVAAVKLMPNPATSPALAKSMVAPEFWKFLNATGKSGDTKFGRYINGTGTFMPGQEQTWSGKYIAMARNAIISNFFFHPTVNIAGNDAVARGIYNLGGAQFGRGGYAYNAARALALQAGLVKPEQFVGGAQAYSDWLGRAMKAGGIAEFGEARTSAMGGDYAKVMTIPSKRLLDRMDKALTKAGDFNRERTFGERGEQAFAVSLFKDAVEKGGMSDAQAGEVVRQALGDYSNFDPKSPWSIFFFFMPWLKGNMKFWANTLIRRPQYATATPHAMRNYGLEESPESYQGAYPTGDFTTYGPGGKPYTLPFVGRDIGHVAQMGAQAIGGDVLGAASTGEQMLAGRATPPGRLVTDTLATINAAFSGDVKGPETDWNMVVNPRAPHDVQMKQAAGYFSTHLIPIPLFTYALQDAVRRGMTPSDLGQALMTAGGAGYFGEAKLDSFTKRQLKKAQSKYKKAYDNYRYNDFGNDYLKSSWNDYIDRLKDLGVVQ